MCTEPTLGRAGALSIVGRRPADRSDALRGSAVSGLVHRPDDTLEPKRLARLSHLGIILGARARETVVPEAMELLSDSAD